MCAPASWPCSACSTPAACRKSTCETAPGVTLMLAKPGAAGADAEPISRAQFLQLFGAVFLPMFLAAVDQTLLAAATPVIAAEFGDLQNSPWVATAYLMASASMVM